MKISRIFLAVLLASSLIAIRAEEEAPQEQQLTQQEQGMQLLAAYYGEIENQCKSIKFELIKNELDQALDAYVATALQNNNNEEVLIQQKETIKTTLLKLAAFLETQRSKLAQVGDARNATIIVGIVHYLQVAHAHAQNIMQADETARGHFEKIMYDLGDFIPKCLE